MNSLKIFYFKALQKICWSFNHLFQLHRIASYKIISKGRYRFAPGLIAGKNFNIISDLSETQVHIGRCLRVRDNFHIVMGHGGEVKIGENCFFNSGCSINCLGSIQVGHNCQFGENVFFYDHNHKHDQNILISEQGYSIGEIRVGNNCWIGSNVIILKDVEIGDNVVIGAGCIIFKSIEANSVVMNKQELQIVKK